MSRPTIEETFGSGANVSVDQDGNASLIIPFSALGVEQFQNSQASDAQVLMALIVRRVAGILNESNRATSPTDTVLTVSYGQYDVLFDPPGSDLLFRRDVWSVIAYDRQSASDFDPFNLA